MPVISFDIDRLLAERIAQVTKDIKVENNMKLSNVSLVPKRDNLLKFEFEFTTEYKQDVGNMKINGHLLFREETKKIKEIMDTWTKTKKLDKELMTLITNFILIKCNIKALELSQQVNLLPHIRLPLVELSSPTKGEKGDYIG